MEITLNFQMFVLQGKVIQLRIYGFGTSAEVQPRLIVPSRKSKPMVVAVFHGESAPALDPFITPFLKEAESLHPLRPRDMVNIGVRPCALRVRCIVADAKERSWLKGQ